MATYLALVDLALEKMDLDQSIDTPEQIAVTESDSVDWYLAVTFILGANKFWFGKLVADLEIYTHKVSSLFCRW